MVCPSAIHDRDNEVISAVVEHTIGSATGHPRHEVAVGGHIAVTLGR